MALSEALARALLRHLGDPTLHTTAIVESEIPTGTTDGANVWYRVKHVPDPPSSFKLYIDGLRRSQATGAYRLTGRDFYLSAPIDVTGDATVELLADYRYRTDAVEVSFDPSTMLSPTRRKRPLGPTATVRRARRLALPWRGV